jgi:excisionase family DNA binding protein
LAHSVEQAAALIGLSRSRTWELIGSGDLIARRVGKRTLVLDEDLKAFLRGLPLQHQQVEVEQPEEVAE